VGFLNHYQSPKEADISFPFVLVLLLKEETMNRRDAEKKEIPEKRLPEFSVESLTLAEA
jgi:hypothetical protein